MNSIVNLKNNYLNAKINLNKTLELILEKNIELIEEITILICSALKGGNRIFWIGNGGSASMSSHLSAELAGRFKIHSRKPLNSISLSSDTALITAVSNDYSFEDIFSRQINALGSQNDILISLSTSGNSKNIINAINCANDLGLYTISFLGASGGLCKEISKHSVLIPSENTTTIQESHLFIGHVICDLIDLEFSK